MRKPYGKILAGGAYLALAACMQTTIAAQSAAAAQEKKTDATARTAANPPETHAAAWQAASAKYDAQRRKLLADVDRGDKAGPFRPDWASLSTYQAPEWLKDAKFGIFIHWGVYSVPAFGSEWYPHEMYTEGTDEYKHQIATYGPLDKFGYKDFIPMFHAEHYDPQAWARLFKEAGARYVVPVFEHHDGFAMYDSSLSDWTAVKMGPHRDLIGELAAAVRAEGMHLGASSHRIEHDWFLGGGRKMWSDVNDPRYADFYGPAQQQLEDGDGSSLQNDWTYVSPAFAEDWLARDAEIVEKYHPDLMWFDWWIGQAAVRPYLARFAAFYYNETAKSGTAGVINYKDKSMIEHAGVLDIERGELGDIRPVTWQTDTSISTKSWGYVKDDTFRSPELIIHQLADIVSKNGNLLLNIGPRPDGTIPEEAQRILKEIGSWLSQNGEAIYGTRPWLKYGEGPTKPAEGSFHDTDVTAYQPEDFRFTSKGTTLYAIELAWPKDGHVLIRSLAPGLKGGTPEVKSVEMVGVNGPLQFEQDKDGLHVQAPETAPCKYAYAYRIELEQASEAGRQK